MRDRVKKIYKEICVPKPEVHFFVIDQEKGESVEENVLRETKPEDVMVYFVT